MSDFNPADFDKKVDLAGLQADIDKAADGQGSYREVPKGATYEVSVKSLEMRATSDKSKNPGQPMIMLIFKVLEGEYAGETIPYFQVIAGEYAGIGISVAKQLLKSLETEHEVFFESYSQFADLVMDIGEAAEQKEYALEYGEGKKGYATYKIKEVFDTE